MFNMQSSVIGPPFQYKDWQDFINLQGKYAKPRLFAHYKFAFRRLFAALFCIFIAMEMKTLYSDEYQLSPAFKEHSLVFKVYYMLMFSYSEYFAFIGGMVLSESSVIAAGFGVYEQDKEMHDEFRLMHIRRFFLSRTSNDLSKTWNLQV